MNEITMSLQADRLLLQALEEDISSEDVTTNAVMPEAAAGQVELICKQEGIIAGLSVSGGYSSCWRNTRRWTFSAGTATP